MKEFIITWEGNVFGTSIIEADSLDDALDKAKQGKDTENTFFNLNGELAGDWKMIHVEASDDEDESMDLI